MLLQWSEKLAVGHQTIDAQHRRLFEKFNDFLEGCDRGVASERLLELLDFLDRYVEEHFSAEEALMARHGYQAALTHAEEHRHFEKLLLALKQELLQTGPTVQVLVRTNKALVHWLTSHIQEVDIRFGAFLSDRS